MALPGWLGRVVRQVAAAIALAAAMTGGTAETPSSGPLPGAVTLPAGTVGADISWPQCPKGLGIPQRPTEGKPLPTPAARFVIIGLTNGPAITPNPCLAAQATWARRHHVGVAAYAVLTYPNPRQAKRFVTLRAFGAAQAAYAVLAMRVAGLGVRTVFVDVEPYPSFPWSDRVAANARVVRGAVAAYRRAGYLVGVYSTTGLWPQVVGGLRLGLLEWRTAGPRGAGEARNRCGARDSFQGGRAVVSQWWGTQRLHDLTCASIDGVFSRAGTP